jgi:hypothetical protein
MIKLSQDVHHASAAPAPARVRAVPHPLLHLPDGALVVLAGLPGAGKTTLLRRLTGTASVRALDSEDVAAALALLPLPYRWLRPVVHPLHLLRVALAVHTGARCVLTTDPYTSPARRRLLQVMARLARRPVHVILIAASPQEARAGRVTRGRHLPAARTMRHERLYAQIPSHVVHARLTRAAAAHAAAAVTEPAPQQVPGTRRESSAPQLPPETHPCGKKENSMQALVTRKRPALGIAATATVLGLWFGLTAPDVSPILEAPAGGVVRTFQGAVAVDQDGDGPGDGGGGQGDGGNGGRR